MARAPHEPVAIIGIGCRFPGGIRRPAQLFNLLLEKRSALSEVPADRWDAAAFFHPDFRKRGHIHVTRGGFLDEIDRFDAAFFGISPNEARRMDPQQRLLLMTSYEALEDAGQPLEGIAGSRTAVMVGISSHDYDCIQGLPSEQNNIQATTNTGSASSIAANRISYVFDLRGPSVAMDTACSSSLTAVHYACRAIWEDEMELALAGGVNLILRPETTMGFSKGGFLAASAECRAFSADASGYVRGEGAGMVLLKPLSKALRDGDSIYALIRGSNINQDGRTFGMTLPSLDAQEAMLRAAYRDAQVEPRAVCYIEAHGTGTPAGDPIEAKALGHVLGQGRDANEVLYLGSVKTNLGHLEPAAGIAGLIKMALCLKHRMVLPNLNFHAPNPQIPFAELKLRVPTEALLLPPSGPLFGGVNSFGFGGANAHLVMESPPAQPTAIPPDLDGERAHVLVVSARSPTALKRAAGELAEYLEKSSADSTSSLASIARTLATRRSAFEFRLAQVASAKAEAARLLRQFSDGDASAIGAHGQVSGEKVRRPVAFLFTGQGPQWWGMGRGLLASNQLFRGVIEAVSAQLQNLGWLAETKSTLVQEMTKDEASSHISSTEVAQPALFALQLGLVAILKSHQILPAAVIGHSIGELAAAVTAGALSLAEATRIVYWRSRSQARAEGKGAMAAVGLSELEATPYLRRALGKVEVAAINGPAAVTIAGEHQAIGEVGRLLAQDGVFFRKLQVSVPFHCFLMEEVESPFRAGLAQVTASDGAIPFYSTVHGGLRRGAELTLDYWYGNIREPVRFAAAMQAMIRDGYTRFLELGPHPSLLRDATETLRQRQTRGKVFPTLRRHSPDDVSMAQLLGELFVEGVTGTPVLPAAQPGVALPSYPFEPVRHWQESEAARATRLRPPAHPVLRGLKSEVVGPDPWVCDLEFDALTETYLTEHRVQGVLVVPAAAQLEAVTAAGRTAYGDNEFFIEDCVFKLPITLSEDGEPQRLRLQVWSDEGHFRIVSSPGGVVHSQGRMNRSGDRFPQQDLSLAGLRTRFDTLVKTDELFGAAAAAGLSLGPSFRGLCRYQKTGSEALAEIETPEPLVHEAKRYFLHPAILDSIIQTVGLASLAGGGETRGLFLPASLGRMKLHHHPRSKRLWCYARMQRDDAMGVLAHVTAFEPDGTVVAELQELEFKYVRGSRRSGAETPALNTYEYRHEQVALSVPKEPLPAGVWLVFSDRRGVGAAVAEWLKAQHRETVILYPGAAFTRVAQGTYEVDLQDAGACLQAVPAGSRVAGLVHLWSLDVQQDEPSSCERLQRLGPVFLAALIPALGARPGVSEAPPQLWMITSGVYAPTSSHPPPSNVAAAMLWGFGRTLASEEQRVMTVLLDLDMQPGRDELQALLHELAAGAIDAEVILRGSERFVPRLVQSASSGAQTRPVEVTRPLRAQVALPGVLHSIMLAEFEQPPLRPDEVRIAVRACGLNFKDVVVAMGLLGDEAWRGGVSGAELGMDCAGVVVEVGSQVRAWRPGDEVVAAAPRALATFAVTTEHLVVGKPPTLSFSQAAAATTIFLTASLGLERLARLARGETVLIHSAAGGVGLAAVQIAQRLGAQIIATASTEAKSNYLRELGVQHVFDSRSGAFRQPVLAATAGRGVDVILNSLSGKALTQSLRCLAPFGRFVEIGKTDLYGNRQIGLLPFAQNISYFCLDINRWVARYQVETQGLLAKILEQLAAGTYQHVPTRRFPMEQAAEALQVLAQGKHIGKVVVEVPQEGTLPARHSRLHCAAGTYLITGGCSGLGLAVAEWLVERGAREIVLLGRRGLPGPGEQAQVDALRGRGANIEVRSCDVGDAQQLKQLFTERFSDPEFGGTSRLRGIFHAAMVLDDGPLGTLTEERFARVSHPKVAGLWNLHLATLDLKLDYFVCFSSIASVLGTPGQANYAAANAFLDAFASYRRGRGLAATTINLGAIDEVGVVARAPAETRKKILSQGVRAMPVQDVLSALEQTLLDNPTQRVIADIDWSRMTLLFADARRRKTFGGLLGADAEKGRGGDVGSLRDRLLAVDEKEQEQLLGAAIAELVARISGQSAEGIDRDISLSRFGLDSLMAAQLGTWLEKELGVELPMVKLLRGPTLSELAQELIARLRSKSSPDPVTHRESPRWLRCRRQSTELAARLFCFPYLGGDGSEFETWAEELHPGIELYTVELPELEGPHAELLANPEASLLAALLPELTKLTELPFAIYGHSIGGFMALELAEVIARELGRTPLFVALGALPTEALRRDGILRHIAHPDEISDADIVRFCERLGVPLERIPDAQARPRTISRMRRDLWLATQNRRSTESGAAAPYTVPTSILCFGGIDDPVLTVDKAERVEIYGRSPQALHPIDGSHLFMIEPAGRRSLLHQLNAYLEQGLAGGLRQNDS